MWEIILKFLLNHLYEELGRHILTDVHNSLSIDLLDRCKYLKTHTGLAHIFEPL